MLESKRIDFGDLIISLLITLGGSSCVTFFTINELSKQSYIEPWFSPPDIAFKIVWPILYVLMAISAYRIYQLKKCEENLNGALVFYTLQLLVNFIWPLIFFKLNLYGISFIVLIILLILAIITMFKFLSLDKISGILFIPYVAWLSFASLLNFFIWKLNEM